MTLEPLFNAAPAIQFHVVTVVAAAIIGGWMLAARKGTRIHRITGRIWVTLMAVTAIASFLIHTIRTVGPFSPIHLLSFATLVSCAVIIWSARTRRIEVHKRTVKALYWGGVGLTGVLTLLPGRIMHAVVFGENPVAATAAPAAGSPSLSDIVTHTPLWVWPLFALILWLGYSKTRPRVVAKWRLLTLPAVFTGLGITSFLFRGISPEALAALAGALAVGSLAGQALARRDEAVEDAEGKVHLKGEYVSLMLVVLIFTARYAGKVEQAIHHGLAGDPRMAMAMAAISGFSIGLTATRALINTGLLTMTRGGLGLLLPPPARSR